jgi:hypothetical protein
MSLAVMDDWADYVFRVAEFIFTDKIEDQSEAEAFAEVKAFCAARTHNIWGATAHDDNPGAVFHYDIEAWMRAPLLAQLSDYRLAEPVVLEFGFSPAKQTERAALIQRYGTTPTGIGRIIIQMGRNRIWREPLAVQGSVFEAATTAVGRRWPT